MSTQYAKILFAVTQGGNTPATFLRDTVAPLVRPGMPSFELLEADIFGP